MQKTQFFSCGFFLIFLMVYSLSISPLDSSPAYDNTIDLSSDSNAESWSRKVKSGSQLYGSFIEVIDNHTYVIGSIGEYFTSDDIYLAKFDRSGAKLWEQTWDGAKYDYIKGYVIDSDNNIYITGMSSAYYIGFSGSIIFLLKYNSSGSLLWSKTIVAPSQNGYEIRSIEIDLNDFIFISYINYNYTDVRTLITKFNSGGIIMWTEDIGLSDYQQELKTQVDSVGNIYLIEKAFNLNLTLHKLNASGSRQWDYDLGVDNYCFQMKVDFEDNIFLLGINNSGDQNFLYLIKINSTGDFVKRVVYPYEGWGLPNLGIWFLESIFVLIGASLFEYNYSIDSEWNITFGNDTIINEGGYYNFGITSDDKMYLIHPRYGVLTILMFNRSGTILSKFKWGGAYHFRTFDTCLDSHDNLYMVCTIGYTNIWNEYTGLAFLVKNPKADTINPYLEQMIDDGEIFLFSLLGISCFISLILVIITLKSKFRQR